jgi:hypothetical protein
MEHDCRKAGTDGSFPRQSQVCFPLAAFSGVDGRYAERTRGRPTFLNLDKPYPEQVFTILIWGESRAKFGAPEQLRIPGQGEQDSGVNVKTIPG